jgi:hypothetical protein
LIAVSERSVAGAINFNGENIQFDLEYINWIVPESGAHNLIYQIELAGLTGLWPEHWNAEAEPLWLKLALAECRQFYDFCAKERRLQAQGDKAVNNMLTNFTVKTQLRNSGSSNHSVILDIINPPRFSF